MAAQYSGIKKIWERTLLICITYVSLEIPFLFNFSFLGEYDIVYFINNLVTLLFLFDTIFHFFVRDKTFFNSNPEPLKDHIQKYLRSWFLIDFISTIPFDLLVRHGMISYEWKFLALLRISRMFRMTKISYFSKNLGRGEFYNPEIMRLVFMVYWISIIAHWIACAWIAIDPRHHLKLSDPVSTYITALYWAVTTLATVGYGDITPETNLQKLFSMVIMVTGVGVFGYVIGNIATMITNFDRARAEFISKIERLNTFIRYNKIPKDIQEEILDYYHYLWENSRAFNEKNILSDLPETLQNKVAMHMSRDIFKKIAIFNEASEELISKLVLKLEPLVFTPGNYIYKKGDPAVNLYFIIKGSVEIISGDEKIIYARLTEGDFFGEMAMIQNTARASTVKSVEYCDLYTLDKDTFYMVLNDFPEFSKKVKGLARERQLGRMKIHKKNRVKNSESFR